MQGNFSYYNPTKLYFGDESLNYLKDELKGYGPVVLLNYGSGSVKRNGIYEQRYFNMPYEQRKQWFSQWNSTD